MIYTLWYSSHKEPLGVSIVILHFLVSAQARQHFAMAELDGMIYVLGGENEDTEVLLTMEVFDPHCNVWRTQPKMTTVRKVRFSSLFFVQIHTLQYSNGSHTFAFLFLSLVAVPPWKRDCMWWAADHMERFMTLWSAMTPKPNSGQQSARLKRGGKVYIWMFTII